MLAIHEEFSEQISVFAPLFARKVFQHVKVLLMGSLLVVGRRTVCSALRAMGLAQEKQFHKYHRVLSKAKWSAHQGARILLELLVDQLVPSDEPLVFGLVGPTGMRPWNDDGVIRSWPEVSTEMPYAPAIAILSSLAVYAGCA